MATAVGVVSNSFASFAGCGCAININKGHAQKVRALLLITLIAGHEGVRVSVSVPDTTSRSSFEEQWIKENSERCVWSLRGCAGRAREACKYRPFALDHGPSCRLRTSYVLHDKSLTETLLKLEMEMLIDNANRFENKCDGNLGALQAWVCLRRLGHMIRALNFLVRVQGSEENITAHGEEIWSQIDQATAAISSVLKDNKDDYVDLTNKVKMNAVEFAKKPASSMDWITDTVEQLASSNETKRMEGRNKVAELPSRTPRTLNEEDLKQLQQVAKDVSANVDPEVESEAFQKLEEMVSSSDGADSVPMIEPRETLTSLLQKSGGLGIFPSKETLVVLVECILVILLILTIVYSVRNQATVPLGDFTGALAGQIGTAAIVYFASGVDFSATKSAAPPPSQTQEMTTLAANEQPTVLTEPPPRSLAPGGKLPPAFNPVPTVRGASFERGGKRRKGSGRNRRQFGVAPRHSSRAGPQFGGALGQTDQFGVVPMWGIQPLNADGL